MKHERARALRQNMTETERFVWQRIRYRQLGGFKFRRQMEIGSYIVDFVCLERRLILELDGGQHAEQVEYDENRTRWLESHFEVLRFWNNEALESWEAVAEVIMRKLNCRVSNPPPQPSPARGEGAELLARGEGEN